MGRLRFWIIVLASIVAFAAIAAPYAVITANQHQADQTQLAVQCEGIRNQIIILEALRSGWMQIGVPWVYPIGEVPTECDGS